ncbi:MAG TPA: glycosyltransferase family 4 protein [Mycobacteriales bacterium]|nr:glycosyltransferase family 4 protein [Mycobacteriales bacterium]
MAERRLRVLLVAGETDGGIGRHVAELARLLGDHGVAATVCGPGSALAAVGESPGVELHELAGGSDPVALLSARRTVGSLARDVDVVHAHGLRAGIVAGGRAASTPLVVTWHNAPLVTGAARVAHAAASRYVARRATLVLGASEDLTELARRYGADEARTTFVVAPALAPASRSREEVRAELGIGSRPMVLAVGRLQAQKRLDVLVAAAARWAGQSAGPVVAIAGSGPDEAMLRSMAAERDAPVVLLGARDDVADLLSAADVVALPSAWEARSLVAQEALRAGVPLVTTPVGGLPDLIGDAGILVPAGDSDALGEAIDRVLAEKSLGRTLSQAGQRQASTWPTAEAAVAELAATYLSLVGR